MGEPDDRSDPLMIVGLGVAGFFVAPLAFKGLGAAIFYWHPFHEVEPGQGFRFLAAGVFLAPLGGLYWAGVGAALGARGRRVAWRAAAAIYATLVLAAVLSIGLT